MTHDRNSPAGWLVKITTPQFRDADPLVETYGAWIPDAVEALAAVEIAAAATKDTPAETIAPFSVEQLRGLGLGGPGEVRLLFVK